MSNKVQFENTTPMNGRTVKASDNFDIVVLNFADSRIPDFKQINNKDWVYCGERNDYPEYLIYQYNKCGKHRAIINGKTKYIFGGGLQGVGGLAPIPNPDGTITPGISVNRAGETMADILKKSIKDIEIHGGFRWFIIYNTLGGIAEIYHEDFSKFRTGKPIITKDNEGRVTNTETTGFYYKEKWINERGFSNEKEKATHYDEYYDGPAPEGQTKGTLVFAYNECGPGTDFYPLPEYVGCANYIDIDIEISKFHLSSLRNGMMPSKMVQFYTGEPTEEKKKEIERRFSKKFAGSENAGKFILVFNSDKNKQVDVSDLSQNELDKMFDLLSKTASQEIFTGHQVVSPMLFGIKTEGQLGGNTELRAAYEIFTNTYAKPKQDDLEKVVNHFGKLLNKGFNYKFTQLDPVGLQFDVKDVVNSLPKEFVFQKLGIPENMWNKPNIGADNKPNIAELPAPAGSILPGQQASDTVTNDNIKNLTAKQHQQLLRIIRQYGKGQLTKEAATTLLRTGLGLDDADILSLLGAEDDQVAMMAFAKEVQSIEATVQVFAAHGDLKNDFKIVKSKPVKFSSHQQAALDELTFYQAFKSATLTVTETNILDLISKDKRITPQVIADTIGSDVAYVEARIRKLEKAGYINTTEQTIGTDLQPERVLLKPLDEIMPPGSAEPETTEIYIKYSYEGPQDNRNRPFCAKLMALDRLYSRTDIENISQQLGYSVWDRRGGWWTTPSGEHSPSCRHRWESHVVVRKTKGGSN